MIKQYSDAEKVAFTLKIKAIIKVVGKKGVFESMNLSKNTFESRLVTQNWKDHEIEYYKTTFNFN